MTHYWVFLLMVAMVGCFVGTVVGELISDWLDYPKFTPSQVDSMIEHTMNWEER